MCSHCHTGSGSLISCRDINDHTKGWQNLNLLHLLLNETQILIISVLQMGLKDDDQFQRFLGFKLQIERISVLVVISIVLFSAVLNNMERVKISEAISNAIVTVNFLVLYLQ